MAPIPHKTVRKPRPAQPQTVSTDNVIDDLGRTLTNLQGRQKRLDRNQNDNITVSRQHAQMNESDQQKGKIIFRDVFPARKYQLTLNDTSWMGDENVVTVGYTADGEFTEIFSTSEVPENNIFEIELPGPMDDVFKIDTVEVRLAGATDTIRGYMEDVTTAGGGLEERVEDIEEAISGEGGIDERIGNLETITEDVSYIGFGFGTCDTEATEADKEVTLDGYQLVKGGYVTVLFDEDVPADATMNVNDCGAVEIVYRNAAIQSGIIKAGDTCMFVYDGDYYRLMAIDRIIGDTSSLDSRVTALEDKE